MVLLSDAAVTTIPVRDCAEPLADLRAVESLRLDARLADERGLYARLRTGVVDRLLAAQALLPDGLRLLVVEGYRPPALQAQYFEESVEQYRISRPDEGLAQWQRMASRYVAPPQVAPHVAGAAVDLTLCTADGVELDLGTAVNDTDTPRCHTSDTTIGAAARRNRDILSAAMESAGMVNYPSEWWHWSYGDRYWAYMTGSDHAHYGPLPGM